MKNLATILSFILIIALIPACEESLEAPGVEDKFLSLIPGGYKGWTVVKGPKDNIIRSIPESELIGSKTYTMRILKFDENQYTLIFGQSDTILPIKITGEVTVLQEQFAYTVRANFRVLENELFKENIWTQSTKINFEIVMRVSFWYVLVIVYSFCG